MSHTLTTVEQHLGQYDKSILYILLAGAAVLSTSTDWSTVTIINALIAAAGVVPVYWVTKWAGLKAVSAGVVAALQAVLILLGPGLGLGQVDAHAWVGVILTGLAAAGVGIVPNAPLIVSNAAATSADPAVITSLPDPDVRAAIEAGPPEDDDAADVPTVQSK